MFYFTDDQDRLLKSIAATEGISEAEVVRRALDLYARERLADPLAELVGAFEGPEDGATRHDGYIYRAR
jgi:hypothetical protein